MMPAPNREMEILCSFFLVIVPRFPSALSAVSAVSIRLARRQNDPGGLGQIRGDVIAVAEQRQGA
jgi:hypothetical protein